MKVEKQYTNYALELRMYPNQEQQILLSQFFGSSRYVYNRALDLNIKQYQKDKTFIWYYDLAKELPKLKKQEETSWLKSIDGTCLQQSLKHFDRALKEFCKSKRNQRKDFNHKLSRRLVNEYDFVFVEDLNIKGMSRGRKRKDPNAKTRKRGLGKAINDLAWGQFVSFLMYKAISEGKFVIKINRYFPSSQLCSYCGYKNENLTLRDRKWICPQCGQVHDRDINAAINILNEGKRLIT